MTHREFYNAIVSDTTINPELREKATELLAKLDESLAKRKEKTSKKYEENLPIANQIFEILSDNPVTASEIANEIGLSVQKVTACAKILVNEGRAAQTEVKVKSKGTQKAYSRIDIGE